MRESIFTEAQIAFTLRQAETGTQADEVCCKMGIMEAPFYRKKKYGSPGVNEHRRLRQLEEKNNHLKPITAGLT